MKFDGYYMCTDTYIQLLFITYKHMENLDFTRHRFCVAPMLDWTNTPYTMRYVAFHGYWVRTVQTYPQFQLSNSI